MIYGMNSRINFGQRHRGDLISTVLREDPAWLDWAREAIKWFELDAEVEEELERALDDDWADDHWEDW
jgi:hypothetical protein